MRVLGVDPAIGSLGFAVADLKSIEELGLIETSPKLPRSERIFEIYRRLGEIMDAHQVDEVVVEDQFAGRNIETLKAINQAKAAVMIAAAERGLPITSYTPTEVKASVTGHGRATKEEVAEAVCRHYASSEVLNRFLATASKTDDVTDALALILTHLTLTSKGATSHAQKEGR